jgi:glycosyltransferase involved in cell wall biosynthesis
MKIFVVIPAFNEEKRIGGVLSDVKKLGYEFIVVDDGSRDKTSKVARKFTPYVLRHTINLGKGAALKTGSLAAFKLGADAVIIMDSDGQHKAPDLPKFAAALQSYDVVLGVRNFAKIPLIRLLGNKLITLVVRLLFGIRSQDILCGFKAFTKSAFRKIRWYSQGYSVETEIVALTGANRLKNCEVPIATLYYDKFKGMSIEQGIGILFEIIQFKLR